MVKRAGKGSDDLEHIKEELKEIEEKVSTSIKERGQEKEDKRQSDQDSSHDFSVIGQEISRTVHRSLKNAKRIERMKSSLTRQVNQLRDAFDDRLGQLESSLTTHLEESNDLQSELTTFKSKVNKKLDALYQHVKKLVTKEKEAEKKRKSLREALQEQEKTIKNLKKRGVSQEKLQANKEKLQKFHKTLQKLQEEQAKQEEIEKLKKETKEQQATLNELQTHFGKEDSFLLNFPNGVIVFPISNGKEVEDMVEEIEKRVYEGRQVPPAIERHSRFRELKGISIEYKGERLETKRNQEIKELIKGDQFPTLQVRPYWKLEDFGGNVQVTINYNNGDKAVFLVPSSTSVKTIKEEVKKRILNIGEGLKPDAKRRWRENIKRGERGTIENLELIGNGRTMKDSTYISELQMEGEGVDVMVSLAYL